MTQLVLTFIILSALFPAFTKIPELTAAASSNPDSDFTVDGHEDLGSGMPGEDIGGALIGSTTANGALSIDEIDDFHAVHTDPMSAAALAEAEDNSCSGLQPTLVGTDGNDELIGTGARDVIIASGGDDTIRGFDRSDSLCGGQGDDEISGGRGNDRMFGGRGNDRLVGWLGNDFLLGGTGRDTLIGGSGDDILIGGPGEDRFSCGDGNDTIRDFSRAEGDTKSDNCENVNKAGLQLDKSYDINVLVISYFPLTEEGTVDVDVTGAPILEGVSYKEIKQKTLDINENLVSALGSASSYLGYVNPSAEQALRYHISDATEHLEPVPISPQPGNPLYPDYAGIMADHNICDYVNNKGIKEVWIWAYEGSPQKLAISESKMSGPFGDISNSGRINDMPLCANTYRVYTFNYERGTAEALESWGHQMEAELDAVDMNDIFRSKFQGPAYPQTFDVNGRCGSVHNPPNARFEYDRWNPTPQPSDCLHWDPNGSGQLADISCQNWGCDFNSDSDNPPLNYMIWNWQNLPGINNTIEFQGQQLRNWWDVHGDFDNVMEGSRRLTA